jgi:hypothetical protein
VPAWTQRIGPTPRLTALLALAPAALFTVSAQVRLDTQDPVNRRVIAAFESALAPGAVRQDPKLACRVDRVPPRLGFDLRLWTGYILAIPVVEFAGQPRSIVTALIRVDPIEPAGPPVYLGRRLNIPAIPSNASKRMYITAGGGFSLGPGRYRVSMVLADVQGRTCLKQWTIKAKAGRGNVSLLAPGEIASPSGGWKGFSPPANPAASRRATIFIDAYPVFRRRHMASLSWRDQMTLLNVLGSILAQGGFNSARVVAFDLARRQIVFDEADFQPASFDSLADAFASINLATIGYSTLAQGPTDRQFLESLVRGLDRASDPGHIVFISPQHLTQLRNGGPRDDSVWEGLSRPALLSLLPFPLPESPVADFARSGKARAFTIYLPTDLASAVRRLASDRP